MTFRQRRAAMRNAGAFSPVRVLLWGCPLVLFLAGCPGTLGSGPWSTGTGGGGPGTGGGAGMNGNGSGGAGGGGGGTGGAPVACDAPTLYFKNTDPANGCGTPGGACHDAQGTGLSGVNLFDDGVWDRLLNTPAKKGMGCAGMNLVNAAAPASGVLIKRISDPNGCGNGSLMPLGAPAPKSAIVECITSWVNSKL